MAKLLSALIYPLDRNINRTWYVEYRLEGSKPLKKYGQLSKLLTVEERLAEGARIIDELKNKYGDIKPSQADEPDIIIRDIQKNFEIRSVYLRPKSIGTYQTKIKEFLVWYRKNKSSAEVHLTGVGHAFVKYLKGKNLNATTINAYRNTIKEFWPKSIPNPFLETFKIPESRVSFRYFDESQQLQLAQVFKYQYPQMWLAIQLQYYLLLRPNELRTIKVGAFQLHENKVRVLGVDSKNTKTQYVAIPDELMEDLQFLKDLPPYFYVLGNRGKPGLAAYGKKHFADLHQKVLKSLGYDCQVYKFYSWKHTGAVMYYLKTGDIKGLQQQGRWHSMDMVNEYLKNLGVMDIERIRVDFPRIGGKGAKVLKLGTVS